MFLYAVGLAFGIDAEAHQASIKNKLQTIGTVGSWTKYDIPKRALWTGKANGRKWWHSF